MKSTVTFSALLLVAGSVGAQSSEPLMLKGYRIGSPMQACPGKTVSQNLHRGKLVCWLGPTTLANEPAKEHAIFLIGGKLAGTMVIMRAKGKAANENLLRALNEKFGEASEDEDGDFAWERGSLVLAFTPSRGSVYLFDTQITGENHARQRAKAVSDL